MRPRAVIFDWGGTLTPWHDIDLVDQWQAYAEVFDPGWHGLAQDLADAELGLWRQVRLTGGAEGTGSLDHIFASVGIAADDVRHGPALAAYLKAWEPHTFADPEARDVLAALRLRGMRIGVLSNTMWPRWHHEAVFSRDGLLTLIDAAVYSSEIAHAKPHAEAFTAVLTALDVVASRAVFVGDRPWDDIHGAQAAGMRAVLLPHSRLGVQGVDIEVVPDATIDRLGDLVHVVDCWLRAG